MQAYFIVFEGPEGAGKTSQIKHLEAKLKAQGLAPVKTREPGGTPSADAIRAIILDPNLEINPLSEFLLYSASRAQHVEDVIKPALEQNKIVICDRFTGASVAYQGYGRGLDLDFIHGLNARVSQGIKPNLTLLLDIDPQKGLARASKRGAKDRLEQASLDFHFKVREGFLAQANGDKTWTLLDAEQSEEALAERIWNVVSQHLKLAAEHHA